MSWISSTIHIIRTSVHIRMNTVIQFPFWSKHIFCHFSFVSLLAAELYLSGIKKLGGEICKKPWYYGDNFLSSYLRCILIITCFNLLFLFLIYAGIFWQTNYGCTFLLLFQFDRTIRYLERSNRGYY